MAEVIEVVEAKSGTKYRVLEMDNGQIRYQNSNNGYFISEDAFDQIETQPETEVDIVERDETDRQNAIERRYPEWNNAEGLDPSRIPSGQSRKQSAIKHFMQRNEIKSDISNDPLLQGRQEMQKAREARARQIAGDLEGASTEKERVQILRRYGISS